MAYLLVILDGAADCPEAELEGKTPLEIAKTPNLDWIAAHGRSCLVHVLQNNKVPQSHTGVLSLLGYDIKSEHVARGPIEAIGYYSYSQLPKGALSARCNFASLVNGRITDRRVCRDISQNEADTLTRHVVESVKLESNLQFQLTSISTYRLSLVIYPGDRELSYQISNTDPGYTVNADYSVPQRDKTFSVVWAKALNESKDSHFTARIINDFTRQSHKVLSQHPLNKLRETKGKLPANFILARDFGIGLPGFEKISEKYALSSTYIYELPVELGLAKLLDMDYVKVPVNSCGNADYIRLAEVISSEMNKYDLVVCHVKGPDEPGHDGDWKAKLDILEKIDRLLLSPIRTSFDFSKDIIIVTSDHATPWSMGTHTADKVPVIIAGKNISPDKVQSFSEKACLPGGMGLYYAHQIIPYIMEVERL
jgi:2,3-bisphosphoglycerate-independent phosphoglycerate mutase